MSETITNKEVWIATYTGGRFYPLDPRPEDVCIADIAHSLSQICRFNGQTLQFYSVAQHSVLVSKLLGQGGPSPILEFMGLIHDAAEAYLCDLVRPIKRDLVCFQEWEDKVFDAIIRGLNIFEDEDCTNIFLRMMWPNCLPGTIRDQVKKADNVILATEAMQIMGVRGPELRKWHLAEEPVDLNIIPWDCLQAEQMFLAEYQRLRDEIRKVMSCQVK